MSILQIGSDRTILNPESPSAARMRAYGKCFGKLNMIIFSTRPSARGTRAGRHGLKRVELEENVNAYPTNSISRFFYILSAIYLGLRLSRPEVVSTQDPFEAGLAGLVISKIRGVPLHVQVHTDFLSPEFAKLSFLNRVRIFLAALVIPRAARIRVVSNRIKNSLKIKNYKLKTVPTVLPIFIDVERFRNTDANQALLARDHLFDYRFLVVSRLEPEKNLELAIDAFARAAIDKSCLIIIGEGSQLGALHEFAEKKAVGKWVFFEGYADPAPYYKVADLVLFPSKYDGYGMVIVEALAAGTPVLSTDVGVAREAGAMVASQKEFPEVLKNWVINGPREGRLKDYPYKNFEEYVRAYCDDISSCTRRN
ncbi:MAG TPA: glycosyltransferase [Candidatus Paceibacterota bacterium]